MTVFAIADFQLPVVIYDLRFQIAKFSNRNPAIAVQNWQSTIGNRKCPHS